MKEDKRGFSGKTFMIVLTSFLLGVIFSQYSGVFENENLGKTGNIPTFERNITQELDLKEFWNVYELLKDNYYYAEDVKKQDLVYGAIKGLVDALGDRHSEFMDPETNSKFQDVLTGDFEGIGAVVEKNYLGVTVDRILKGSPAKEAGIKSGDIIIEANEEDLSELSLYDAVEKIKGPAGTQVSLKVLRSGESDFLSFTITRAKIQIPSVEFEIFEDTNIGYISLNVYGETTTEEFKKALNEVKIQDVTGLIIDVRDNGGGYLQSAVEILSEFIEEGEVIVQTKYRDSYFNKNYYSVNDGGIFNKKVVVLINGNSASASEITAGALREYDKAILVGEKTYGKGSVQQPFDMNGGSLLKLTIANWYTPQGKTIEGEGIEPDVLIEFQKEDFETSYDRQLEEAKKILQSFIDIDSLQLAIDSYVKNSEE